MGGKSTYMRAIGVATILAHCGCFVPAQSATLSIVDGVLCRMGAQDFLSSGLSTFMAEMLEISAVLNSATDRSLVIVDELGRGTSTFDGFGLAWTIAEQIVLTKKSLMVFATHFHEMSFIETTSKGRLVNVHVSAETKGNELIRFLYEIHPGPCDRSFGVAIAQLAGLPEGVVAAARAKAQELERTRSNNGSSGTNTTCSSSTNFAQSNNGAGGSQQSSGNLMMNNTNDNNSRDKLTSEVFGKLGPQNAPKSTGGESSGSVFSPFSNSSTSSGSPNALTMDGAAGFLDPDARLQLLELARKTSKVQSIDDLHYLAKEASAVFSASDD
jgi:DNA mismatch repair ATPase MutS